MATNYRLGIVEHIRRKTHTGGEVTEVLGPRWFNFPNLTYREVYRRSAAACLEARKDKVAWKYAGWIEQYEMLERDDTPEDVPRRR